MKKPLRLVKDKEKNKNPPPIPNEIPASEDITPIVDPHDLPFRKQPDDDLSCGDCENCLERKASLQISKSP